VRRATRLRHRHGGFRRAGRDHSASERYDESDVVGADPLEGPVLGAVCADGEETLRAAR